MRFFGGAICRRALLARAVEQANSTLTKRLRVSPEVLLADAREALYAVLEIGCMWSTQAHRGLTKMGSFICFSRSAKMRREFADARVDLIAQCAR